MKIGDVYYRVIPDDEEVKIDIDIHILRTIRGKYGYLILKEPWTWGKKSKTAGDFGWLDPIPDWCRTKFRVADGPPKEFARSKSQALRVAISKEQGYIKDGFAQDNAPQILKLLKSRLKSELTRKKRKK